MSKLVKVKKKDQEALHWVLADILYRGQKIWSDGEIVDAINDLKKERDLPHGKEMERAELSRWITLVRTRLEEIKKATLVRIRGKNGTEGGYKIAAAGSRDIAIFAMQHARRTVMLADRTNRLHPMVDPKHIPEAIEEVFSRASNRIHGLSEIKRRFVTDWTRAMKPQRKEIANGKGDERGGHK